MGGIQPKGGNTALTGDDILKGAWGSALEEHTQPLETIKTIPFRNQDPILARQGPHAGLNTPFSKEQGLLEIIFKDKCFARRTEQHA